MPLSEHEQRQLELIEQALYREDRRLGRLVRSSDPRVHYRRRVVQACSGIVVSIGMVVAGLILRQPWHIYLAAAGVVVMLVSGVWALTSWRHKAGMTVSAAGPAPVGVRRARRGTRRGSPGRPKRGHAGRSSLMERLDERWRRRMEGDR